MVAWCVKERESVNLIHRFRVVFLLSVLRLVRAWPASQARASFSRRFSKARFCINTAGQLFLLLYFLL